MNPQRSDGSRGPKCYCGHSLSKVIETRPRRYGTYRRRECCLCGNRFNTMETSVPEKVHTVVPDLMSGTDIVIHFPSMED